MIWSQSRRTSSSWIDVVSLSLAMPSYKLIYFNARGRAEETRLLFAAAGVKYEDCRLNGEEFAKLKAGKGL